MKTEQSMALAKPPQRTIETILMSKKEEFEKVLPKHMTVDRLLKVALVCINKTPNLAKCTLPSLASSVMACAELGLEPASALGLVYLIPFKVKGIYTCQFMVGYRGYIELARRSGVLSSIESRLVYEKDKFELEHGFVPKFSHKPELIEDPGKALFGYSIARFKDGGHHIETMTMREVLKIRDNSKSWKFKPNEGPWHDNFDEMARKTLIRRIQKYLPLSPEEARANELDSDVVEGEVLSSKEVEKPAPLNILPIAGVDSPAEEDEGVDPTTGEVLDTEPSPSSASAAVVDAAPQTADPLVPMGADLVEQLFARLNEAQSDKDLDAVVLESKKLDLGDRRKAFGDALQLKRREVRNG